MLQANPGPTGIKPVVLPDNTQRDRDAAQARA